jgi:hypothetical protein
MELIRAILVNFVVPLAGLKVFLSLRERMLERQIERPPVVPLFIIFATYGGLLMVVLTVLFLRWSGMASLGVFYLVLIAPIAMTVLAVMLYRQRRLSPYHFGSFIASGIYPCVVVPTVVLYWVLYP